MERQAAVTFESLMGGVKFEVVTVYCCEVNERWFLMYLLPSTESL